MKAVVEEVWSEWEDGACQLGMSGSDMVESLRLPAIVMVVVVVISGRWTCCCYWYERGTGFVVVLVWEINRLGTWLWWAGRLGE